MKALLTDNGAAYVSELNTYFCYISGIKQLFTGYYHKQTDGKAERKFRDIKQQLRILNGETHDEFNTFTKRSL